MGGESKSPGHSAGGLECLGDDEGRRDGGHAGVVDRAGSEEAGRAGRDAPDEGMISVAGEAGAGEFGGSAAERDDDAGSEGGGKVHRTAVVGDDGVAEFEGGTEFPEGCFAGEV